MKNSGYFTSDAMRHPQLRQAFEGFHSNPSLHAALSLILGGEDQYYALPRNDLMVDQAAAPRWHRDKLTDAVGKFIPVPQFTDFGGESFGLVNAGFYLEDHSNDDDGLWVAPGSHSREDYPSPRHNASVHTVLLRPKAGDVIIWDYRTYHRGGFDCTGAGNGDNSKRQMGGQSHRTLFAASFGKKNIFSEVVAHGLDLAHMTNTFSEERMSLS
jgi:hypothetical protein